MDHEEGAILYEMQRVDLEFAVVQSLAKEMSRKGKTDIAEHLKIASEHLRQSALALHAAHKWLNVSFGEQIKMDFIDE